MWVGFHLQRHTLALKFATAERPSGSKSEMTLKRKRVHLESDTGLSTSSREDADSNDEEDSDDFQEGHEVQYDERVDAMRSYSHHRGHLKDISAIPLGVEKKGPGTLLNLGNGLKYEIPQYYDEYAPSLSLPPFSSLQIEEKVVYGRLKATAFFAIMDADPWTRVWRKQYELGESWARAPGRDGKQRLPEQRKFGLQVNVELIMLNDPHVAILIFDLIPRLMCIIKFCQITWKRCIKFMCETSP